ncbi:hypothetical protein SCHPADRAFT_946924 [Schizopora paradoxa]|uniref:Uncharacterized protein n=1 Tax=Schizopora paradoxa TaxID=27342 RepID=A0A0H2R150_9AGAM|nr:hypothetical protein SCHPADRAFT_946924 [Schizopora paradoxa]
MSAPECLLQYETPTFHSLDMTHEGRLFHSVSSLASTARVAVIAKGTSYEIRIVNSKGTITMPPTPRWVVTYVPEAELVIIEEKERKEKSLFRFIDANYASLFSQQIMHFQAFFHDEIVEADRQTTDIAQGRAHHLSVIDGQESADFRLSGGTQEGEDGRLAAGTQEGGDSTDADATDEQAAATVENNEVLQPFRRLVTEEEAAALADQILEGGRVED